ncbi:Uncharacterised protein [Mycobacteroides abscessus]|nr:Uncharacterised protein [Mycobacteroides abscessus]
MNGASRKPRQPSTMVSHRDADVLSDASPPESPSTCLTRSAGRSAPCVSPRTPPANHSAAPATTAATATRPSGIPRRTRSVALPRTAASMPLTLPLRTSPTIPESATPTSRSRCRRPRPRVSPDRPITTASDATAPVSLTCPVNPV